MAGNFTELQIANKALARLAADTVESEDNSIARITTNSLEADLIRANFAIIRDTVLEDRVWSFSLRRVTLTTPAPVAPAFGFARRFVIPADALNVWRVFRRGDYNERLLHTDPWILEDQHILTDLESVHVQYVARLDSSNIYKATPLFIDALSVRLAAELAIPLAENRTLYNDLLREYEHRLVQASAVDGNQATREILRANSLTNIRASGTLIDLGGGSA